MARIDMKGINEYTLAISRLEHGLRDKIVGRAIYDGAAIVADTIKGELQAMPTDKGIGSPEKPLRGPSELQKNALIQSFGITKMRIDHGVYSVKIGFDGYNQIRTTRWPKGQPNAMIARSVEKGTSFMEKNAFVKRSMSICRKRALAAMEATADEQIKKLMGQ